MNKNENLSLSSFSPICILGKGSYAHVLLVEAEGAVCHNETTKNFALKMIDKTDIEFRKSEKSIFRERDILLRLQDCPFVTDLKACFQGDQEVSFLLEFCPGGDLFERLNKSTPFPEKITRFYIAQLALALHQIHQKKVVFRDLKPENLLFDAEGYLKLADFGCGEIDKDRMKGLSGTPEYMAPEMVRDSKEGSGYDFGVDWWALGCLMFEMMTKRTPFVNKNRKKLYEMICQEKLEIPGNLSELAKDLISKLLEKDPQRRAGFNQIKKHPWFKDFDWELVENKKMKAPWVPKTIEDFGIGNFNKKFVDMDFDGIICGMSEGLWLEDLYFESENMDWIIRQSQLASPTNDTEEWNSQDDTEDEEQFGRCDSFSEFDDQFGDCDWMDQEEGGEYQESWN